MERGDTEEWARAYATATTLVPSGFTEKKARGFYASAYAYAAAWLDYSDAQADGYAQFY